MSPKRHAIKHTVKHEVKSSKIVTTKRNSSNSTNKVKNATTIVMIFAVIMAIFGLLMIFDASSYIANRDFGNQFHFVILQAIWLGIGLIPAILIYLWDYRKFCKLALPGMIVIIGLLIAVLIFGTDINGAKRWFAIGEIPIQPAELLKPIFIIYLAAWLAKERSEKFKFFSFKDLLKTEFAKKTLTFLAILLVVLLLVILEPDLGTTMIIGITAVIMFYISGTDQIHRYGSIGIGIVFAILAGIAGILESYRFQRILTFLDLLRTGDVADKMGAGYQIYQILIGIGSGGFFGKGFGQSRQRFGYLVENTAFTDSIFAIILEELGTIGGIIIIVGWFAFALSGLTIAYSSKDRLGQLLAAGITIWLTLQAFLNMAANVGLMPLTGIPLPFLTYGGSNTLVTIIGIAILLNIGKINSQNK